MNIKTHIIYLAIIMATIIIAVIGFLRPKQTIEKVVEKIDTTIVVKIDTITHTDIKYVDKIIADTVYVPINYKGFGIVPMYNYHFKEEGKYDILAYGYGIIIKNVTVYPSTKTIYVNNTIEREIIQKQWNCYLGLGISTLNDRIIPNINVGIKTPNRWFITANIGYCDMGVMYGLGIMYKLGK